MEKKKVKFVEDRVVKDHNGDVVEKFQAGKTYNLPIASADRWLRRGVAVDPSSTKAAPKPKQVAPEKESAGEGEGEGGEKTED